MNCPACTSASVRVAPASRATHRRVARCRDCGAHFWANRADFAEELEKPTGSAAEGRTAQDYSEWVDIKREQAGPDAWRETATWLRASQVGARSDPPRLFDVGAGDGQFLQIARDEFGFEVTGNELAPGAVDLARQRYGVELELGDLGRLDHEQDVDAVTLWCVLAHVPDGDELMSQVFRMLRPGGALALQTPHWTGADAMAHLAQRSTGGRASALTDRRIAQHHWILHTRRSITAQLNRLGFVDVVAVPRRRYTLTAYAYLASMNPPAWTLRPGTWLLDKAVASPVAPRIVLDVRARRPR